MNCCDEYGNCHQGRDCPIRRNRAHGNPLQPADRQVLPWVAAAVAVFALLVHLLLYLAA